MQKLAATATALASVMAEPETRDENVTKRRIRGLFLKYPDRRFTKKQLDEHFNDVTPFNVGYHLSTLVKSGFCVNEPRGVYFYNPKWQSLSEKRAAVAAHIESNPRVIQTGEPFSPLTPALTVVESPSVIAQLALAFAASITARMRASQPTFCEADCEFFERVVKERFAK